MEIENKKLAAKSGKVLLFDMDGTLTEARREITVEIVAMINDLCSLGHKVCVVSGSPYSYIEEQLAIGKHAYSKDLHLMSCNGTQLYTQNEIDGTYENVYSTTMRSHLSENSSLQSPYRELVQNILELQSYAIRRFNFPVTGNFLSDRGSMINWSMIGRDASHEDRLTFALEDNQTNLRKHLCDCLRVRLDDSDLRTIDLALGGTTSVDIFPKGWDKTYALRHLDDRSEVWFWGDKCTPGGNDHTLYKRLLKNGRSFSIDGPNETKDSVALQKAIGLLK